MNEKNTNVEEREVTTEEMTIVVDEKTEKAIKRMNSLKKWASRIALVGSGILIGKLLLTGEAEAEDDEDSEEELEVVAEEE